MGETAPAREVRGAIPLTASLTVDPERLARLWALTPAQRRHGAERGEFSLGEMLRWASRRPDEVPVVDGEWFFITAYLADVADYGEERRGEARR